MIKIHSMEYEFQWQLSQYSDSLEAGLYVVCFLTEARYFPSFQNINGFGGLVDSMLASGYRVCGFDPDRCRWIFSDVKKSSACLPSEGK
jgi:hypothetical protein